MGEKPESFETLLGQLQKIVDRLEGGQLPLEEALATFEQGVHLAREAGERLDAAERRVEILLKDSSVQEFQTGAGR